ncbi:molecular chaperone of HSP90 family [Desulfosporosinus orientis DSM 765]|uniref:Chaperone protein HtpG n=1 Tax=Desulfosporosinus orientis (strain ATCC 19365 / DSM 765 / NCIMB 8382 / VKM B-1628 / Singapore I) TaxID=768706 RepID=G7W5W0_DESOD|nr:molecular chaperone HtpG [Desulfosporosinus orientis]AET67336.1 molecular chaperone of HSP90 family [Desulfosporosinus orientis DSM 765]
MSTAGETKEFQTEIKQLLDIVIHSLYTEREIFLRELISNSADATEKLRYTQLSGSEVKDKETPLEIQINTDDTNHTLTIIDAGIGMTKEELVENLGTIAHSGSKEFIKHLTAKGDQKDLNLIGQFGVGFYSAFMAADKVTIFTRSYHVEGESFIWESDGVGSYTITPGEDQVRGTKMVLQLKEDAYEFAKEETIKRVIKQYSSFVPYPILVNGEKVNTVDALWTKNKSEISEEDYTEFYKFIANAFDEPLLRLHFSSDAPININTLLFVPKENMEQFGFGRTEPGVSLYCKKVLIQEKSPVVLPEWLRFLRGVIDSEELPLNISRETLQDSALVSKLNKVVTSRFLKFLDGQATSDPEKYKEFWEKFNFFLKEGAANDYTHQKELLKLLRFESSNTASGELVSLADYVGRMKEDQTSVYYVNGPSREVIESGPYLEVFKNKGFEVIYTYAAIDDYIFGLVREYEGKKLISADEADLNLGDEQQERSEEALSEEDAAALTNWLKEVLGTKVTEVRESKRLVDSPAVVFSPYGTNSMQRMMQLVNKDFNNVGPSVLEINASHPMIKRLDAARKNEDAFAKIAAEQIFENAQIAAGLIVDPRGMVNRLNEILERALG